MSWSTARCQTQLYLIKILWPEPQVFWWVQFLPIVRALSALSANPTKYQVWLFVTFHRTYYSRCNDLSSCFSCLKLFLIFSTLCQIICSAQPIVQILNDIDSIASQICPTALTTCVKTCGAVNRPKGRQRKAHACSWMWNVSHFWKSELIGIYRYASLRSLEVTNVPLIGDFSTVASDSMQKHFGLMNLFNGFKFNIGRQPPVFSGADRWSGLWVVNGVSVCVGGNHLFNMLGTYFRVLSEVLHPLKGMGDWLWTWLVTVVIADDQMNCVLFLHPMCCLVTNLTCK